MSMWQAFRLDRPNLREVPFYRSTVEGANQISVEAEDVSLKIELSRLDPNADKGEGSVAHFLENRIAGVVSVGFIDLLTHPVGDTWTFTSRLLSMLNEPKNDHDQPLIIIDNVDGFEVLVGELNAFGEPSSVRARIMQAIQAAQGKAHLAFVAEESGTGAKPLADVSDVVVHLRIVEELGYLNRVIEVTKARAQAIHRGPHCFLIRTGTGSTTGLQENVDDPRTTNAYVQVIPSLHTVSRRIMNEPTKPPSYFDFTRYRRAGFGIKYLDDLCGDAPQLPAGDRSAFQSDSSGLAYGTLTAIIGDANTSKTDVAHKFLRRGFELFAENLDSLFSDWIKTGSIGKSGRIREALAAIRAARDTTQSSPSVPRDGTSGHPSRPTIEDVKKRFGNAFKQVRVQAEFLADVLLLGRNNVDTLWTREALAKELEKLHSPTNLSPALAAVCRECAARILIAHVRRLPAKEINDRRELAYLREASIPDASTYKDLGDKFFDNRLVTGMDFLKAAPRQAPEGEFQRRTEAAFLNPAISRLETVRAVIAHYGPGNNGGNVMIEPLAAKQDAYSFLRSRFRGSTDIITSEQESELRSCTISRCRAFKESDLLIRVFAGIAIGWIDAQVQETQQDPSIWLAKVPFLAST